MSSSSPPAASAPAPTPPCTWRRALASLAKTLRHRRDIATDAITGTFGVGALAHRPKGGYHLWVSLPEQSDSRQFASDALTRGVSITPGHNYFVSTNGTPHIRISYIAAPSPADIADAIGRLAAVLPRGR